VRALLAMEGGLALCTGYLLALLVAARRCEVDSESLSCEPRIEVSRSPMKLVVLIPAHDEQEGLGATLQSLISSDYPSHSRRIVVIADNCTDRTAERAREAGVEVWERRDPARRGKGFALQWALRRLSTTPESCEAVVLVDADCVASPNMLAAIEGRLRGGARALQVNYLAGNPGVSHASALRYAGFALMNTVRFQGKQRLGLSCGLVGTGMAFTMDLLRREPWTATGLTEDAEYHMRLVQAGERAEFVSEAWVSSAMPTSLRGGAQQQARWEQGKLQLMRRFGPRLLASGVVGRDVVRMHAGLEYLVPPQSLIAAGSLGSALAGLALGSRRLLSLSLATLAGQLVFVLAGLRFVRAPASVYRALILAPALIAGKVALYVRLLVGGGPSSWVRTEREPLDRGGAR
jgi:1,2-diacylglycerol 3-beta-glucosyltransferase